MPMFFNTKVSNSKIHGLGLFAEELIPKGSIFWRHDIIIDGWVDIRNVESRQGFDVFLKQMDYFYCYDKSLDLYIRHADNIIFINHSNNPNLNSPTKYIHITSKDIQVGEELTLNYCDICDDGWKVVEEINDRHSEN